MPSPFAPFADLATALLPHAFSAADDGSHDISHLARVWANARAIHAQEGGDLEILAAATILHDCISLEKNDPRRAQASALAAQKARGVLEDLGWETPRIDAASHAIHAHSFSANIPPETLEAQILQDADRLDAIGMIGVARCFYVGGRMNSQLYAPHDPAGQNRDLDDRQFALDHFEAKLLTLAEGFQTKTGAKMAQIRHNRLLSFRAALLAEISGEVELT